MPDLLTIDEALAAVLARAPSLGAETVAVARAAGRVLAEDAVAAVDLPGFRSSAMDGYAVRVADGSGSRRIVDRSAAGRPAHRALGPGEAIEISTGAVVPDGADAVVPVEEVVVDGESVTVAVVQEGDNIRPVGGDVTAGAVVAEAGSVVGPAQVGALAAAGIAEVRCGRVPRVAILPTGTELRAPGDTLGAGEIYESNGVMLAAQVASAGGLADRLPPVGDDPDATRAALARALDADVLITSGGVSVGPHDLVRGTLAELGAEEVFWRVSMRPGKPIAFAVRRSTLVFGLPGNPVSSLVGFELFVRPALLALQGAAEPGPRFRPAVLGAPVRRGAERDALVRARTRVDGDRLVVDPLRGQESHMIVRSSAADALVLVPRGEGELAAGAAVSYVPV
ncbi:MAG TPA: gephyrin-like molybdotransferase Glp [Gaiellaceae bacterium]|nr:gephyrin-like molybdotransferase Glp [Gaiellaceae bacterium]